jgi:hypothetical protein
MNNIPPKTIPVKLFKEYTLNSELPVIDYYFNDTIQNNKVKY